MNYNLLFIELEDAYCNDRIARKTGKHEDYYKGKLDGLLAGMDALNINIGNVNPEVLGLVKGLTIKEAKEQGYKIHAIADNLEELISFYPQINIEMFDFYIDDYIVRYGIAYNYKSNRWFTYKIN